MNLWSDKVKTCRDCQHWGDLNKTGTKEGCKLLRNDLSHGTAYQNGVRRMKRVIDVCCGSKMFYFDKDNPDVEFCDNREVDNLEYYPGRILNVKPNTISDFTDLPFEDGSFKVVVFDPPHLIHAGDASWSRLKYGRLEEDWEDTLKGGFMECMRVLDKDGLMIFKWSAIQIPLRDVLALFPVEPLLGEKRGRNKNTHWLIFMKP